jgi:S-adenosylmethionine:tRNA ribosyltransferase-isomerase
VNQDAFQFDLPGDLIAQTPAARRGDARLLLVEPGKGPAGERVFRDLPGLLRRGDLLVLNESRVLPARLHTRRVDTGGRVEILLVQPVERSGEWLALARPARRLREGVRLAAGGAELMVTGRTPDGMVIVGGDEDPAALARRAGVMPLPPYIRRAPDDPRADEDRRRYQTVFAADEAGSVAAPTAGLHFSGSSLEALAAAGVGTVRVTLHVGPGTFQPPTGDQIAARRLHREYFRLPAATAARIAAARRSGGRVIAVGTTSLRVLETAARLDLTEGGPDTVPFEEPDGFFTGAARRVDGTWEVAGATRLFIAPPDRVSCVDGLLTNFHLPGSSLLMLVAALAGDPAWRRVYEYAVRERMRFYSYGDCMLILPGCGDDP